VKEPGKHERPGAGAPGRNRRPRPPAGLVHGGSAGSPARAARFRGTFGRLATGAGRRPTVFGSAQTIKLP